MDNEVIYNELVRQYEEGNNADNTINKKIDFLLLVSVAFIGYFFTVDNFLQIPIKGSLLVKHIFGAGIISLIISLFYTFKAFLLMKYKRGLKIDKVEMVVKKHPQITGNDILNFSPINTISSTINYNINVMIGNVLTYA